MNQRRVVITSVGLITSLGNMPEQILDHLQNGNANFCFSPHVENTVICPIRDFDLTEFVGRNKNKRYLNRGAAVSVAAAAQTIRHSGIEAHDLANAGLFAGAGPNLDIGVNSRSFAVDKPDWDKIEALWMLKFLPNTAASVIAQMFGIHGENHSIGTACAASLQAIGEGFRKIRDGYLNLALAGGGDSRLSKGGLMAYRKAGALSGETANPLSASRPFDTGSTGFVPGEGGAFVLIEEFDHARGRGANILAEVCGYGNSIDGHAMTAPEPEGKWAEQAVRGALSDAGISSGQVDLISSHGTGTPLNDAMEAQLIDRVFGTHQPPVIALKSWIGHLSAACGAAELAICLICLRYGYFPEIRNLTSPCHPAPGFLKKSLEFVPETILLENFGFGGQNSALVIRSWKP